MGYCQALGVALHLVPTVVCSCWQNVEWHSASRGPSAVQQSLYLFAGVWAEGERGGVDGGRVLEGRYLGQRRHPRGVGVDAVDGIVVQRLVDRRTRRRSLHLYPVHAVRLLATSLQIVSSISQSHAHF